MRGSVKLSTDMELADRVGEDPTGAPAATAAIEDVDTAGDETAGDETAGVAEGAATDTEGVETAGADTAGAACVAAGAAIEGAAGATDGDTEGAGVAATAAKDPFERAAAISAFVIVGAALKVGFAAT